MMHPEIERREAKQAGGDPYFLARIRGDNGKIVWRAEEYESKQAAEHALHLLQEWLRQVGPQAIQPEYIGFDSE